MYNIHCKSNGLWGENDEVIFSCHGDLDSPAIYALAKDKYDRGEMASDGQRLPEEAKWTGMLNDRCLPKLMDNKMVYNTSDILVMFIICDTEKYPASKFIRYNKNDITIRFPETKDEIKEYGDNFKIFDGNNHGLAFGEADILKVTGGKFSMIKNIMVSFRWNIGKEAQIDLINQANNSNHNMNHNDQMKSAYLADILPHEVTMEYAMMEAQSRMNSPISGKVNFGRKCSVKSPYAKNKTCTTSGSIPAANIVGILSGYASTTKKSGQVKFEEHYDDKKKPNDFIRLVCRAKGIEYPEKLPYDATDDEKKQFEEAKNNVIQKAAEVVTDYTLAIQKADDGNPFGGKKTVYISEEETAKWNNTKYTIMLGMITIFVEKAIATDQELNMDFFCKEYKNFLNAYSVKNEQSYLNCSLLNVRAIDGIGAVDRFKFRANCEKDMIRMLNDQRMMKLKAERAKKHAVCFA